MDDNNTPRTSRRKIPRLSAASYPSVIVTANLGGWRCGLTVLARTPIGGDLAASTLPQVDAKAIENIWLQESLAFLSLQGLMASSAGHMGPCYLIGCLAVTARGYERQPYSAGNGQPRR